MSTFCERRRASQRGNFLFESLIAVLLTGLVGAGMTQIAARVAVSQHEVKARGIAVAQVREVLTTHGPGVCGSTGHSVVLTDDVDASIELTCTVAPTITVTPSVVAASAPVTTDVAGVPSMTAKVRLDALGIRADADAAFEIGTQQ